MKMVNRLNIITELYDTVFLNLSYLIFTCTYSFSNNIRQGVRQISNIDIDVITKRIEFIKVNSGVLYQRNRIRSPEFTIPSSITMVVIKLFVSTLFDKNFDKKSITTKKTYKRIPGTTTS
jgi:hypothetical protein